MIGEPIERPTSAPPTQGPTAAPVTGDFVFKLTDTMKEQIEVDGRIYGFPEGTYAMGLAYNAELFEKGEIFMSFTLPLRSGDFLTCRIPLFFIILFSAFVGGLVVMLLRHGQYKFLSKRGLWLETKGDYVIEMREHGKKLLEEIKAK